MWTDRVLTATCIEDVADWDSEKEHWTSVYIANQPGPFVPAIENAQVETFDDLLRLLDEDARELKALWADDGRQVGRREGRIEVRKESQREGEAAALLRLLERLFGPIDEAVRGRIVSADEDMLVGWIDRVLTAACLGDVMDQEDL